MGQTAPYNIFIERTSGYFGLENGRPVPISAFQQPSAANPNPYRLSQDEAVSRVMHVMGYVSHHTKPDDVAPARAVATLAALVHPPLQTHRQNSPLVPHLAQKAEELHTALTLDWRADETVKDKIAETLGVEWKDLPAYGSVFYRADVAGRWIEKAIIHAETKRVGPAAQNDSRVWTAMLESHRDTERGIVALDAAQLITPNVAHAMHHAANQSEARLSGYRADWAPQASAQRGALGAAIEELEKTGFGGRGAVFEARAHLKNAETRFDNASKKVVEMPGNEAGSDLSNLLPRTKENAQQEFAHAG